MSFPPRPSPSIRYPSQGNLTAPTSLPQYPPMPYLQPGSSSSQPRILTSQVNRGPSYGNPNGKGPPPDGHRYFRLPGRGEEQPPRNPIHLHNGSPETMREEAKTAPKKRPRQSSTSQNPSQSDKTSPASPKAPPSVLVREKKQKACANCRRAKLKCIVEFGDADCVRCRARKERCIFYPRSHDEDWQQTVTNDVYVAISHLSNLSSAVHHILHHLSARQVIPPFNGLEIFEAPERDMAVLSGWGVEKQRDGSNEDAKKRKRKGREQSDDEDDAEDERDDRDDPPPSGSSVSFAPPIRNNSLSERPWSIPPPLPHHFSEPVLPPFRPQLAHSGSIQLTPTSELDVPVLVPQTYYAPMVMPSPMAPPHLPPQPQNQSPSIVTPGSMHNATPTSMINSSPAVETDGASFSAMHMSQREQDEMVEADPEDAEEVLGKDDKRPSIISNQIISPRDARILVDHFHELLSPSLFGYHLQFHHFPYLPEGPRTMTPFILAVLCSVSSERLTQFSELHGPLRDEVTQLLISSPAGSWQNLVGAKAALDSPHPELGEDALDPELGIGPEEIVGACILATFWSGASKDGVVIASHAFRWARGWIKLLKGPDRATIAEAIGFVPAERRANEDDMARVWLLCYIVDGTYAINCVTTPPPSRDPLRWCQSLVPTFSPSGETSHPGAYDILLTFHARLIKILHDWLIHRYPLASLSTLDHKRLAASANAALDLWKDELDSLGLDPWWTREVDLFWLYAKINVNATAASGLAGSKETSVRNANRTMALEAAVGLLERCTDWNPRDALVNLPNCYFNMIMLAAGEMTKAISESASTGGSGCPVTPADVLPLLRHIRDTLYAGNMEKSHVSSLTAVSLAQSCQDLEALC